MPININSEGFRQGKKRSKSKVCFLFYQLMLRSFPTLGIWVTYFRRKDFCQVDRVLAKAAFMVSFEGSSLHPHWSKDNDILWNIEWTVICKKLGTTGTLKFLSSQLIGSGWLANIYFQKARSLTKNQHPQSKSLYFVNSTNCWQSLCSSTINYSFS